MKYFRAVATTLTVSLVAVGLFLSPFFQTYLNTNLETLEPSNPTDLAFTSEASLQAEYLNNIDFYLEQYNNFKQESQTLIQKEIKTKQITNIENPEILSEFDAVRKPSEYKLSNFTDISPASLQLLNTEQLNTKIETQSLPSMQGFSSSTIAHNSSNINVFQQFSVVFPIAPNQQQLDSLQFRPQASFSKTVSGNTVTIKPTRLQRNTNYTFGVFAGFGICGGNGNCSENTDIWSHAVGFRTAIKEMILTGFTVQGSPIFAHAYGNADSNGKSILLTGATHGEEWHSGGLWKWVGWLDANQNEFANKNKEMLVITEINIDGANMQRATRRFDTAARYNSRGVNLNRNFPNQWAGCSICGASPASEPETQAVMGVSLVENVIHMIAYHNQWPPVGIIFLGDNGNPTTVAWAQWTGTKTGYPVGIYNGPEVATSSGGDVPGDQVVWAESVGIRGLLIEGSYRGVDDYAKNFPMYIALVSEF